MCMWFYVYVCPPSPSSWLSEMSGQLVMDDLPDDVEGAESLLTTHAEHKVEIHARDAQFEAFNNKGESLIKAHHYATSEVRKKQTQLSVTCVQKISLRKKQFLMFRLE